MSVHQRNSLKSVFLHFRCNNFKRNFHSRKVPCKEIRIPTHCGHLAGKLWGAQNRQPVLALHGWQDNAGSWGSLAPILAEYCPILALDLPGHGFSSWYPPGMQYHFWDGLFLIHYIKEYLGYEETTLLTHSLSSCTALRYASLFPKHIKAFVAIDALIYNNQFEYANCIKKFFDCQKWVMENNNSYSLDTIKKKIYLGLNKSIDEDNLCYLTERGLRSSTTQFDRYFLSRDPRLKYLLFPAEDLELLKELVSKMTVPTLYIRASGGIYSNTSISTSLEEFIKNSNKKFESMLVEGTHHVHLNRPEIVAPLVPTEFLQKI